MFSRFSRDAGDAFEPSASASAIRFEEIGEAMIEDELSNVASRTNKVDFILIVLMLRSDGRRGETARYLCFRRDQIRSGGSRGRWFEGNEMTRWDADLIWNRLFSRRGIKNERDRD